MDQITFFNFRNFLHCLDTRVLAKFQTVCTSNSQMHSLIYYARQQYTMPVVLCDKDQVQVQYMPQIHSEITKSYYRDSWGHLKLYFDISRQYGLRYIYPRRHKNITDHFTNFHKLDFTNFLTT